VVLASPVCVRISMKAVARMGMKAVTMVLTSVWLKHLQSSVRRLRLGRDRVDCHQGQGEEHGRGLSCIGLSV